MERVSSTTTNGGETIMDTLNAITGGYKKQFIEEMQEYGNERL